MIGIDSKEHFLRLAECNGKDFFIAGAGNFGTIAGEYLEMHRTNWGGFFDMSSRKIKLCGKPVFSYADVKPKHFILISAESYVSDIQQNLQSKGVSEDHIFVFSNRDILMELLLCVHKNEICAYKSVADFKNSHRNQRCFIIGNGPSLAIQDLNHLENEISFACNSIYGLYKRTKWRPTYYCISDPLAARMIGLPKGASKIQGQYEYLFSGVINWRHLQRLKNVVLLKTKPGICDDMKCAEFSNDAYKVIYNAGTVAYVMIQLAIYMGFSKIFLLGIDFSFSAERHHNGTVELNDVQNHADLIEEEDVKYYQHIKTLTGYSYFADIDYQLWGYQAAKKYADGHGIKIYNATRGGKLEVFPRVNFDSLF